MSAQVHTGWRRPPLRSSSRNGKNSGKTFSLTLTFKQGIDQPTAKQIIKMIKDAKLKVQASIQGEQVRVNGKKRDDLQSAIALLKESKLEIPLQFNNFRD